MKLKPINVDTVIYARPTGWYYHLDRNCPVIIGYKFDQYNYSVVPPNYIEKFHLIPCTCAYADSENRKTKNSRKPPNNPRPTKDTTQGG